MFPIDPRIFLSAEDAQPFIYTQSRDLAATDGSLKKVSEGKYIIFQMRPAKGQVLVVKSVIPWAMQRDNVGLPTEDVSFCNPAQVNGQVLYETFVGGNAPVLFDTTVPAFKTAAAASNNDLTGGKGIPFISPDPWSDAQRSWFNPMFTFLVKSGTDLMVTFSILRPSVTNPIPVVYTVPPTAGAARRIDFAGVTIVGLSMSEQTYVRTLNTVTSAPGA